MTGRLLARAALTLELTKIVGEVIDTGPGIEERVLEKIFELYYSTKDDGHGLGLAISRRIVEEHGGFFKVQSEVGKGSQFSVYLPLEAGV